MTSQSFTGTIDTNGEFVSISSLTDITFTVGAEYSIQIQNLGLFKVADAVYTIKDEKFIFTAGNDEPYIKNYSVPIILTIYGAE